MNGHRLFVDTNILIMLVEGNERVAELLDGCKIFTSFVTELELLGNQGLRSRQVATLESLLSDCVIFDVNPMTAKQ